VLGSSRQSASAKDHRSVIKSVLAANGGVLEARIAGTAATEARLALPFRCWGMLGSFRRPQPPNKRLKLAARVN